MNILLVFTLALLGSLALAMDIPLKLFQRDSVNTGNIASDRGQFSPPQDLFDEATLNQYLLGQMDEEQKELKKVKYFLINGETRMAQLYLQSIANTQTKLKPVVYRYLGMLAFIDGKFEKSYKYLDLPELRNTPHFSKICTLKVLNMVVLNKIIGLKGEWEACLVENDRNQQASNVIWLDTLVNMKLHTASKSTRAPFKDVKLQALENDQLKVFLKLALYLNQENMIYKSLADLSLDQLKDEEVRELVGQIHFRSGSLAKAYRYIEDLNSPNAENIKGNLYVLRDKYELAYAQFKLAIEKKQNSQNAMERILPLAWLLGDWTEGAKYAERVLASPQTQINKLALVAAFNIQRGDFNRAKTVLNNIEGKSRYAGYVDVTQLQSFVGLMQNDAGHIRKYANESCKQYDFVNCWMLFQLEQWESFPLTMRRTDDIEEKREWEKLTENFESKGIKETVYINQLDIEELDDGLIQLIPNAP